MDKLHAITTCRNRCRLSSAEITGHQCDPSVVAATRSVCGCRVALVVHPLPFLLSVCLSILSLVLGSGAGQRAAGLSHSLCPQKLGLQTLSPHDFPKPQRGRNSQALKKLLFQ